MNVEAAFKWFDVRGDYPEVVNERLAFIIGKSLSFLKSPKKVLMASDLRESSPSLKNYLADGLSGEVKIYDLGNAPVPEFYYTVATGGFDLGIMVTASHIGNRENGFKFSNQDGLPFDQGEILQLKDFVSKNIYLPIVVLKTETISLDNSANYIEEIISLLPKTDYKLNVLLDVSYSVVVNIVKTLFSRLKINYKLFEKSPMGSPLFLENSREFSKEIIAQKADLGIKWDSDGDRVVFLNNEGQMISLSFVLGILGANEKGGVVVDVRAGLVTRDLITEVGGSINILPAWGQYIKFAMQKDPKIIFGGETSGHFIYKNFHLIDDGIFAALKFLNLYEKPEIREKLKLLTKKYFEIPEKNFPVDLNKAAEILEKLTESYRKLGYDVSIKDGLTVFGKNFKFNLRPSLTEPFLRLNLEAQSEKQSQEIIHELEKYLLV